MESQRCSRCGDTGRDESDDGFFYCQGCGAQLDIVTGDDYFLLEGFNTAHFTRTSQRPSDFDVNPSPQTCFRRYTQEEHTLNPSSVRVKKEQDDYFNSYPYSDAMGPTEPDDFGSVASGTLTYEDYYNEVRIRYVMGIQWMIQMQCEALVEKFNVRPMICGVASTVWLRFLAGTGVFNDGWADDVLLQSESQSQRDLKERRIDSAHRNEPRNAVGERAVIVWFKHLRKTIPLSCSLAISFLACHIAREGILPTDILKWSIEGELPYFAAHVEIEKRFEFSSPACNINPSLMFRPSQTVPVQRLEKTAATIADSIGLHLPPVNFYEIASRYLKKLSLLVDMILPHACRIYEWSMPSELWLSANELRLPTRVCVMSILIVTIRILYDINGFGVWEGSLSNRNCSSSDSEVSSSDQTTQLDASELLNRLEALYNEIGATNYEFTKDLPSYLKYCKDVVFAGAGSSNIDYKEEELIEKLWDFYQNAKDSELGEESAGMRSSNLFNQKRSWTNNGSLESPVEKKFCDWMHNSPSADISTDTAANISHGKPESRCLSNSSQGDKNSELNNEDSDETWKEKAIRQLKMDMEENRFYYIPPRVNIKKLEYLHYARKKDDGALTYVAHADYYILLRACARVAEVDIRNLHIGVLTFERRLSWLENRIDCCLHLTLPSVTCEFCRDDTINIGNLNL